MASTAGKIAATACAAFFFANGAVHAETTREKVLREGKIVIGISNAAPWGFRDREGAPAGFHPDLVQAAFSKLGISRVEIVVTEFGALIPALSAHRFDAVAAGLYISAERCKLVAFSDPDLRLADAAIVPKGNRWNIHSYADIAANPQIKFGVGRGSTTAKNAAAAGVPEETMQLFPDIQSNVSALLSGRIDVAAFSAPTVVRILSEQKIAGIERVVPFHGVSAKGREHFGYSAIAFRPEDRDLRDLYNARLRDMKADGTLAQFMAKYGFSAQETAPQLTSDEICNGGG